MNKHKTKKEDFINMLKSMSKEDIHNFILQKGKEPKLVTPVVYYK